MKVRDVMTRPVVTVEPATTFKATVELMIEHGVSGLPIVDAERALVGLVTEADLMSKEAFGGRHRRPLGALLDLLSGDRRWTVKAEGLTAGDLMTTNVVTARPEEDIRAAARRMLERGVKRLPVVDDGLLVGIVSRPDILRQFHRSDAQIATEIEARLASPLHCPEHHAVSFGVEEGVVILTGSVRFSGEVDVIEGMARSVPGVVHVVSTIDYELEDGG